MAPSSVGVRPETVDLGGAVSGSPLPESAEANGLQAADREWLIVKVTSLAHFLCHLGELIFPGVMLAVRDEMQLSPSQTTDLAVLGYVLFGAGALPVGLWADARDSRRILLIYFAAMTAAGLAVAAAPTPLLLFAALTFLGLATSMYHPVGLAMISLGVTRRGRALGVNGVAGSFGIALGPALGLAASWLGLWQAAYLVFAGLAAICGAVAFRDLRRLPAQKAAQPTPRMENLPVPARSPALAPLAILLLVMLCAGFNYRCLMTALPAFLSGGDHFLAGGVYIFVITLVGGSIGQLLGGVLADRWGARRVYLFLVAALAPLSLLLGTGQDVSVAAAVAALLAMAMFAQQPVENSLLAENSSHGRRSVSYGLKFVLTFGVGALGTPVVGLIWENLGSFNPVFYLMAMVSVVMAGLLMLFLLVSAGTRMAIAPMVTAPSFGREPVMKEF